MRTRQEVGTLAVHWRHYLYAELLNLLSQIPLIEQRCSSKRLSDLRCKESYLMDCLGEFASILPSRVFDHIPHLSPVSLRHISMPR